jgi:hypothetical protein
MLLYVAAHNVSIRNVKVSKRKRYITYRVTKCTASQNVKSTLCNRYKTFFNGIRFVTLYVMWHLHFENFTFLELLRCVHLRFLTLRHVMFTLCCFTLCSNIRWLCSVCLAYFQANCLLTSFTNRKRKYIEEKMTATLKSNQISIITVLYHLLYQ